MGDRVLEVNGADVTGMNPNEIVKLLTSENGKSGAVTFKLEPAEMPAVIAWKESRHVRALVRSFCVLLIVCIKRYFFFHVMM